MPVIQDFTSVPVLDYSLVESGQNLAPLKDGLRLTFGSIDKPKFLSQLRHALIYVGWGLTYIFKFTSKLLSYTGSST